MLSVEVWSCVSAPGDANTSMSCCVGPQQLQADNPSVSRTAISQSHSGWGWEQTALLEPPECGLEWKMGNKDYIATQEKSQQSTGLLTSLTSLNTVI